LKTAKFAPARRLTRASIQPRTPEFAHLGGIFPSPSIGDQFSVRADVRLNAKPNAFVRASHRSSDRVARALFNGARLSF